MNLSETARLLGAMAAFDRRTVGDGDVIAWQAVLSDAAFEDCLEAVKQHYAEQTDWMMPAHVRRAVRDMVSQREMAARATGWAPGQAGVPKDQALPEAATGARLALSDLPAAVAELVARVRADLPEGSREALRPRTVAWEREHAAFQRQQDALPNPRYRPKATTCAEPDTCYAFDHAHNYPSAPDDGLGVRGYSADQVLLDEQPNYDPMPDRDDPALADWLKARGWASYEAWAARDRRGEPSGVRLTPCGCGPEHGPHCRGPLETATDA